MRQIIGSESGLLRVWVSSGSGRRVLRLAGSVCCRSGRGSRHHAGTITNATTVRVGARSRRRAIASRYRSMPLLRYSQRPDVATMNVSSGSFLPTSEEATLSSTLRAASRTLGNFPLLGTKFCSNPFGVTTGRRWSSCSHSMAVMSLTVVKQSAWWAAAFSRECFDSILSSRAIWSPSYARR